jgi:hypothetical protein
LPLACAKPPRSQGILHAIIAQPQQELEHPPHLTRWT